MKNVKLIYFLFVLIFQGSRTQGWKIMSFLWKDLERAKSATFGMLMSLLMILFVVKRFCLLLKDTVERSHRVPMKSKDNLVRFVRI